MPEKVTMADKSLIFRIACSQDAESRALLTVLNECTERVESREMTEETCQQVKKIIFFVELFKEINLLLFLILFFRNNSILSVTETTASLTIFSTT